MAGTLSQLEAPLASLDEHSLDASTARRAMQEWMHSAPWQRLSESRELFNRWVAMSRVFSDSVADNPKILLRPPPSEESRKPEPAVRD
jgi:hypothetical protein